MNTPLLISLSLSLFSFFLSQAKDAPNPVLDINGTMVQDGSKYYVVPLDPEQAGLGFNLFSLGIENGCPKSVFLAEPYYWSCLIAFHHPVNNPDNKGMILELTDLNIEIFFDQYTAPCPEPSFWKIDGDPSRYDVTHNITTGGEHGNLSSWFKIVKTQNGYYKFMYCPSVCDHCRVVCKDVGISEADESRLVLSDAPFEFTLRRPETLVNDVAIPESLDVLGDIVSVNSDFTNQQTIS